MKKTTKGLFTLLFALMLISSVFVTKQLTVDASANSQDTKQQSKTNQHQDTSKVSKNNPSNKENPKNQQALSLKDGDIDVLQGDGTVTYHDDGSATFHVTSNKKNKIVFPNIKKMKDGILEADIKADQDLTRFGFIYRVKDANTYKYVGSQDTANKYFSEIFGKANKWTAVSKGPNLTANETHHMRIKFVDDSVKLYIDNKKVNTWSQSKGTDEKGLVGFEKSRGGANITISNVHAVEYIPPEPPKVDPVENTLKSDFMDVTIDETFPRIIKYQSDNKVMAGQEKPVYGLKVNGMLYYPDVSFEKVNNHQALYTMKVKDETENIDLTAKVSITVKDSKVIYQFESIDNKGNAPIETISFNNMHVVSANSSQDEAQAMLTSISSDVTKLGDKKVDINKKLDNIGSSHKYYTAFLTTGELAAGVWTSSEVNGYGNLVVDRYQDGDDNKALGIASNKFYYHRSFMSNHQELPSMKIALAKDNNNDKKVDWQDAAIAYRDIMQTIKGYEDVNNNVGMRIAMNFGSQAQHPFMETLDNIKKTALATDGLGQAILLKGYASEGHDSGHPDYGHVGERMGGKADLQKLIQNAHQFNTEIGVHINAQETYPEAKAFSDDFIDGPSSLGWGWLDQAYTINKIKDLASGSRAKRLDNLKKAAPGLDFIYLDVWYQDQWESDRIAEQFMDRGWRVSTEFGTAITNYSTWQHWAADKNYGGAASKGINSDVLRFISNHQRDSWVLNWPEAGGTADHPLLGGFELAGYEGWQSDKNYDHFIRKTFNVNVPTKFLQKYYVTNWIKKDGDSSKTNLTQEVDLKDPSNSDKVVVKRKDNSRERTITLNGNVILDGHKYLLPWVKQDFDHQTPTAEKLYHWNEDGGTSTWTLPDSFNDVDQVYLYKLTDQGRTDVQKLKVTNHQITINADKHTPYVVTRKKGETDVKDFDWNTDGHIYDEGFNSGTINDDYTNISGDKKAVTVKRTNKTKDSRNLSSGEYYLDIDSPSSKTEVKRTIHHLKPGKDYVAEVYVQNNSNQKAAISVKGAKNDVSNYTLKSLQKNYVKADSHASNDGYNSKMQRMQVSFTAKTDEATLVLSREAGKGNTMFDDIRLVQKTLNNFVSDNVFEQDFENVVQGIYPFVIGNAEGVNDNRIHLSELHAPYTQKGWAGKVVDDVLDGHWSVKVNTGNKGLVYRTLPQNFHFEPGITYKVSFDYQTTSDSYRFISGDKAIDVKQINQAEGLDNNKKLDPATDTKRVTFTVKGSKNNRTYIGIFSDGTSVNMAKGQGTFMLDNLHIEKIPQAEGVADILSLLNKFDSQGEISDTKAVHQMMLHLKAVQHFEKAEKTDKIVKHLDGFKKLLKHELKAENLSTKAYQSLLDATDEVMKKWNE